MHRGRQGNADDERRSLMKKEIATSAMVLVGGLCLAISGGCILLEEHPDPPEMSDSDVDEGGLVDVNDATTHSDVSDSSQDCSMIH